MFFCTHGCFSSILYSFPYHNVFNMWSSYLHMFLATLRNTPRVVISNLVTFITSKGDESDQHISLNHLNTTEVK